MRDAIVTPEWQEFYDATGVPAAVRVGKTVRLTGHTGTRPDGSFSPDPVEQLRQTFQNIADTFAAAGCGCGTAAWQSVTRRTVCEGPVRAG